MEESEEDQEGRCRRARSRGAEEDRRANAGGSGGSGGAKVVYSRCRFELCFCRADDINEFKTSDMFPCSGTATIPMEVSLLLGVTRLCPDTRTAVAIVSSNMTTYTTAVIIRRSLHLAMHIIAAAVAKCHEARSRIAQSRTCSGVARHLMFHGNPRSHQSHSQGCLHHGTCCDAMNCCGRGQAGAS